MATDISKGDACWVRVGPTSYREGEVVRVDSGTAHVSVQGKAQEYALHDVLPSNPYASLGEEDLSRLVHLNEPGILHNLRFRYEWDLIYTYAGSSLLAINPFKRLPIYRPKNVDRYRGHASKNLAPHVFGVANDAYDAMVHTLRNQSIVISGESGSGKTETTKIVLRYLSDVSGALGVGYLEEKISQANPILEAFGNAKTVRNNNSSRFGKFLRVQFGSKGSLTGMGLEQYLLEKSRVVRIAEGERNFHIFYQLLQGAPDSELSRLGLSRAGSYAILTGSSCFKIDDIDDAADYRTLVRALELVDFSAAECSDIFLTIAAILHLGNLSFVGEDASKLSNDKSCAAATAQVCKLFGLSTAQIETSLCSKQIKAGTQWLSRALRRDEAMGSRDALSKILFDRLFAWVVRRIDKSLREDGREAAFVGVLDIFGFESFAKNSFEQLCINYTNEILQSFYCDFVFKRELAMYESEGIRYDDVTYPNNDDCLTLLDTKGTGLFQIIDEQGALPQPTDEKLYDAVHAVQRNHTLLSAPKVSREAPRFGFVVQHYAGPVTYDVDGFLAKNSDVVPKDFVAMFAQAKPPLLREIFANDLAQQEDVQKRGGRSGKKSVGARFRSQLVSLMDLLHATSPHFIRCIKPNHKLQPGVFDQDYVCAQLNYSGVLDAIRIQLSGWPLRVPVGDFTRRFWPLVPLPRPDDPRDSSSKILKVAGITENEGQVGKTMVFFRKQGMKKVEVYFDQVVGSAVRTAQRVVRGFLQRRRYQRMRAAAKCLQRYARTIVQRRRFERVRLAARILQRMWRAHVQHARFIRRWEAAEAIQRVFRGMRGRKAARAARVRARVAAELRAATDAGKSLEEAAAALEARPETDLQNELGNDAVSSDADLRAVLEEARREQELERSDPHYRVKQQLRRLLERIHQRAGTRKALQDALLGALSELERNSDEHARSFLSISQGLSPDGASAGRRATMSLRPADREATPIYAGLLQKSKSGGVRARVTMKTRYFALLAGSIRYYKNSSESVPLGEIPLANATVSAGETAGQGRVGFQVATSDRVFYLWADSEAIRDEWIRQIETVLRGDEGAAQEAQQSDAGAAPASTRASSGHEEEAAAAAAAAVESPEAVPADVVPLLYYVHGAIDRLALGRARLQWALGSAEALLPFVQPSRYNMEGFLNKASVEEGMMKSRNIRWMTLRNGAISWYRQRGNKEPAGTVQLEEVAEIEEHGASAGEYLFELRMKSRSLMLWAADEVTYRRWIDTIHMAVDDERHKAEANAETDAETETRATKGSAVPPQLTAPPRMSAVANPLSLVGNDSEYEHVATQLAERFQEEDKCTSDLDDRVSSVQHQCAAVLTELRGTQGSRMTLEQVKACSSDALSLLNPQLQAWLSKAHYRNGRMVQWQRRWAVLVDGYLVYFRKRHADTPAGVICMDSATVHEVGADSHSFKVHAPTCTYVFQCESADEYSTWFEHVREAHTTWSVAGAADGSGALDSETADGKPPNAAHVSIGSNAVQMTGYLRKSHGLAVTEKWISRYFVLENLKLFYFRDEGTRVPLGTIEIASCTISSCSDRRFNSFSIQSPYKTYFLEASTRESFLAWMQALRDAQAYIKAHQLVQSSGNARQSGYLMKTKQLHPEVWKRRFVRLRTSQRRRYLDYFREESDSHPAGVIPLEDIQITNITGAKTRRNFAFELRTIHRSFFFAAESEVELVAWMQAIHGSDREQELAGIQDDEQFENIAEANKDLPDGALPAVKFPRYAGYIVKRGAYVRSWKRRYFVLENGLIFYYKSEQDYPLHPKGVIPNIELSLIRRTDREADRQFCLELQHPRVSAGYFFAAPDREHVHEWQKAVRDTRAIFTKTVAGKTSVHVASSGREVVMYNGESFPSARGTIERRGGRIIHQFTKKQIIVRNGFLFLVPLSDSELYPDFALPLDGAVVQASEGSLVFEVTSPSLDAALLLRASSREEKEQWVDLITESATLLAEVNERVKQRRKVERELVLQRDADSASLHWFCIDAKWLKKWQEFTSPGSTAPPPGPITNGVLFFRDGVTLKPNLVLGKNYRVVNKGVWLALFEIYGGGPEVQRTAQDIYEGHEQARGPVGGHYGEDDDDEEDDEDDEEVGEDDGDEDEDDDYDYENGTGDAAAPTAAEVRSSDGSTHANGAEARTSVHTANVASRASSENDTRRSELHAEALREAVEARSARPPSVASPAARRSEGDRVSDCPPQRPVPLPPVPRDPTDALRERVPSQGTRALGADAAGAQRRVLLSAEGSQMLENSCVIDWSTSQVDRFIRACATDEVADLLRDGEVDGRKLLQLSEEDLRIAGIARHTVRAELLTLLATVRKQQGDGKH